MVMILSPFDRISMIDSLAVSTDTATAEAADSKQVHISWDGRFGPPRFRKCTPTGFECVYAKYAFCKSKLFETWIGAQLAG